MTKQRPTIKGKGVDFFFSKKSGQLPEQTTRHTDIQATRLRKTNFLLPQSLVDKLDDVWLELRKSHRKVNKSRIARIALGELLSDYERNNENSKLSNHLNGKTSSHQ